MTEAEAIPIIRKAFEALSDVQRANLRWHAANGTRVFCGPHADDQYTSPDDDYG